MEMRQVAYVVAVAEHGSFTRAAAAEHVAQPSLSQGIKTLEKELGVALFHRIGRGVVLSSAGEAFLGPARQLLRAAGAAQAAVASVQGVVAGRLDLVALPTLAVDPLARLVGTFRRRHPGVTVRVAEPDESTEIAEWLRTGRAEVGLADLPAGPDLVAVRLFTQELLAVCPPGTELPGTGRLSIDEVALFPIITTPPGTSTRRLVEQALGPARARPEVAVELAQREAILPLVLAGAGMSFLPGSLAEDGARRGAVVARLRPAVSREIGLVHRSGPLSPAAAAFVDLASEEVGNLPRPARRPRGS